MPAEGQWARIRRQDSFGRKLESKVAHMVITVNSDQVVAVCGGNPGRRIIDPSAPKCKNCERL